MMGFEPTTFCMASRRSSQLSYIRERSQYSRAPRGIRRHRLRCRQRLERIQGFVDEPVGELVVGPANCRVRDSLQPGGQLGSFALERAQRLVPDLVLASHLLDE